MKVYATTQIGVGKTVCDDSVLVNDVILNNDSVDICDAEIKMICVADGVGGNSGGKDASQFVLNQLASISDINDIDDLKTKLLYINDELISYSKKEVDKNQMATTLTGIAKCNDKLLLFHVGNTRLYAMQGSYLKQISKDHTTYQYLMMRGCYEEAEACNKNEIMYCFGGGNGSFASGLTVCEIYDGEIPKTLVLTSDGIHDYVSIDDIEEIIAREEDDSVIADRLISKARENGSTDDASIVLIRSDI